MENKITDVYCIGYNCSTVLVSKELQLRKYASVFDWCHVGPTGVSSVLAYLYINGVDKTFKKLIPDISNTESNIESGFEMLMPHYKNTQESRDKFLRRLKRLNILLNDTDRNILFLYVGPAHPSHRLEIGGELLSDQPINGLIKISKIISMYRPKNTYQICCIDSGEMSTDISKFNIKHFSGPIVELEKFYIYPCMDIVRKNYQFDISNNKFL